MNVRTECVQLQPEQRGELAEQTGNSKQVHMVNTRNTAEIHVDTAATRLISDLILCVCLIVAESFRW